MIRTAICLVGILFDSLSHEAGGVDHALSQIALCFNKLLMIGIRLEKQYRSINELQEVE